MTSLEGYETAVFEVVTWKGITREFLDSIKVDDRLAIKGRMEIIDGKMVLIAEQIEELELI